MPSLQTNKEPIRRKLSFVLPALVFLSFAALEKVQITAVADTIVSFTADEPAQTNVVPVTYEQPIRVACPHGGNA